FLVVRRRLGTRDRSVHAGDRRALPAAALARAAGGRRALLPPPLRRAADARRVRRAAARARRARRAARRAVPGGRDDRAARERIGLAAGRAVVTRVRICDAAVAAGCVLIAAGLVIDLATVADGGLFADAVANLVLVPAVVSLAVLAPVIVRPRPDNAIGPVFARLALDTGFFVVADAYGVSVAHPDLGARDHDDFAAWLANFVW